MLAAQESSPALFSIAASLALHPFFEALPPDAIEALAACASSRAFTAGQTLLLEGDPSAGLWLIEKGSVKVYKVNPEGDELILLLLGPGQSFNEIPALDGGPNPANAAAISDSTCWLLPGQAVQDALRQYPDLALSIIGKLTARVRTLVNRLEDLTLYSVASRLARFLIQQSDDPALQATGVTRAAIAAHLATTPETISRILRSFEEAGAIRFDRHRIVIVDPAALRMIAML